NPSSYQASMGYEALKQLVDRVSILIMNREEACKFLGRDPAQRSDMPELVRSMVKIPGQIGGITDGDKGVWICKEGTVYTGKSTENLNVVETTGAGDAFASTFTAAIMRGLSIDKALDYGMTNAE